MSDPAPNRFFDLAMKSISGQADEKERAELEKLKAEDENLENEYNRLKAESELLKETIPLAEATQATEEEFPEWARANLQLEVEEVFGKPEVQPDQESHLQEAHPAMASLHQSEFAAEPMRKVSLWPRMLLRLGAVCALVGISISIVIFALRGKKDWVENTEFAMEANLCLMVSNLVVQAETDYGTNSIPSLMSGTYADAKKWLSEKNTLYASAKKQIKDLQSVTHNLTLDKLELVSTNVTTLSNQLASCCVDVTIQNELELALLEVVNSFMEAKWTNRLEGEKLIDQVITEFDEAVQNYQNQPDELFKALPALRERVLSTQQYATNAVINIRPSLAQNALQLGAQLEKMDADLTTFRSSMGALGLLEPRPEKPPKIDVASFIPAVEAIAGSGFLDEVVSSGGKRVAAALKKDYQNDMVRDFVFQSDVALMNFVATAGRNLYPAKPLPQNESIFWPGLPAQWEYKTLMTNSTRVTLNLRNAQNVTVRAPVGPHLIYWANATTIVYLTPRMVPIVGKAPVIVPDNVRAALFQQYKYREPVLEYRDFYAKEFHNKYLGGQPPKFIRSPWDYLESLSTAKEQKRIHALIAAYQQQQILKFIFTLPIERQLQYGVPSKKTSQTFANKLKAINLPGLDAKAWLLNPEIEQKYAKELGELNQLITQTKGFLDYRKLLVQANRVEFGFVGFYQDGVKLFEGDELASGESVIYLKKGGTYGIREIGLLGESGQNDNQGPVDFSPLFTYTYRLTGADSYEDMKNKYDYFSDLPKSLKKALSETNNN